MKLILKATGLMALMALMAVAQTSPPGSGAVTNAVSIIPAEGKYYVVYDNNLTGPAYDHEWEANAVLQDFRLRHWPGYHTNYPVIDTVLTNHPTVQPGYAGTNTAARVAPARTSLEPKLAHPLPPLPGPLAAKQAAHFIPSHE